MSYLGWGPALLNRVVTAFLGKKQKGETEIEKKIREALRERARLCSVLPSPSAPVTEPPAASSSSTSSTSSTSTAPPPAPPSKHRHIVSLNAIALKFPKADSAFRQIREKFDQYDKDKSQSIDVEELKECLRELQVSLSEAEIQELFEEADMDSSNGVQFKEFILLMAIVHLLRPSDSTTGARFGLPEVEVAFDMVEDAFNFFDEDGDGYLTRDEVHHALTSGREAIAGSAATQRFAEMDYNTDGLCSFKEFLYAYVGWVGTAEDDEEQEGAQSASLDKHAAAHVPLPDEEAVDKDA